MSSLTYTFCRGVNISHWLAQFHAEKPYAGAWFTASDCEWIARQGFDHVRIPVDGRVWAEGDGDLKEDKVTPFDVALKWAEKAGLGVILDMHYLPGASFEPTSQENHVFTDLGLQATVAGFWRKVAARYAAVGTQLRFEILNEPVAVDAAGLNAFNRRMLGAIRETNPQRVVYITSNRWSHFDRVAALEVPEDEAVAITLHFYEPFVFTHQRANWMEFSPDMPLVRFPGVVPDLTGSASAGHWILESAGKVLSYAEIEEAFDRVQKWAADHAPGREIHIGEFGAYRTGADEDRRYYAACVRAAAERRGWGWAVWDYRGGFAVRDEQGRGTQVLEGLFPGALARS
jgi:endoglucanase